MNWENPEPGVYEAQTTMRVRLEVFQPNDDDPDLYSWWAVSRGRVIAKGESVGLERAQAAVVAAVR